MSKPELTRSPTVRAIKVYSRNKKKWFEFIAKFDTGTRENWITSAVVGLLEHTVVTGPRTQFTTFDGSVFNSSELVEHVLWHGDGEHARSRHTHFRMISERAPFQILFGSEFIFSQDLMSFNEDALILATVRETQRKPPPRVLKPQDANLSARGAGTSRSSWKKGRGRCDCIGQAATDD